MIRRFYRSAGWTVVFLLYVAVHSASAQENHTLWSVKSGTNTVYLMGSLHVMKSSHYPLSSALEAAFTDAKHLVTEVDIDSMMSPLVVTNMTMRGMYTDGATLQQHVSVNTFNITRRNVEEIGLNIQRLQPFRPWFVALSILGLKLQKLGFDPTQGLDRYFYEKARREKKQTHAFESVGFQIGLLSSLSEAHQEALLLQTIRDLENIESFFDDMYTAWAGGDAGKLDAMLLDSLKDYPEVYTELITSRNRNWISQIEGYLKQKDNYLIVVGAGHLVGKDNVVDMLIKKGYKVEQR